MSTQLLEKPAEFSPGRAASEPNITHRLTDAGHRDILSAPAVAGLKEFVSKETDPRAKDLHEKLAEQVIKNAESLGPPPRFH